MIFSDALFSDCRRYRYSLTRQWENLFSKGGVCMFIGLNPSTADEIHNDPTVTRCIRFARGWGFSKLHMTNIFAYRSTDPAALKCADDPVGPLNDSALVALSEISEIVVAAWGVHGGLLGRGNYVRDLIPNLYCLGTTRDGYPRHPLYLKKDLEPMKY